MLQSFQHIFSFLLHQQQKPNLWAGNETRKNVCLSRQESKWKSSEWRNCDLFQADHKAPEFINTAFGFSHINHRVFFFKATKNDMVGMLISITFPLSLTYHISNMSHNAADVTGRSLWVWEQNSFKEMLSHLKAVTRNPVRVESCECDLTNLMTIKKFVSAALNNN